MNIRLNALKNYNTGAVSSVSKVKGEKISSLKTQTVDTTKTDVVSIRANAGDFSAAKIKTEISSDVNSLSNADRIARLKEQVADGTYNVSSQDIAESILDRFA